MSLIYYPAIDFYGSDIPMLSLVSSTLFLAGLAIVLWRVRSPRFLLLNGYFWALTLSIGIFSIPASADSYRMLVVLPPALLMAAAGLDQILDFLGLGWGQARTKYIAVSAFTLSGLFIFNTSAYYFNFANHCKYGGDTPTRFATYLGNYMSQVDSDSRIYLLSNESYYYGPHLTVDFLSRQRAVQNVPEGIDSLSLVSGDTLVANPDRIDELQLWARLHPGGDLVTQHDCQNRILSAYHVP
jgi:hypothetical protein